MLKQVMKRWTSLVLVFVMVLGMLPAMTVPVAAAEVKDIVEGLDAGGDITEMTDGIKVEATSTAAGSGCGSVAAKEKAASATLTSTLNVEAKLAFDYTISVAKSDDGYVKINGEEQTAAGHFEQMVAGGGKVTFDVFSGTPAGEDTKTYTSKIEITNISLSEDKMVTTTFLPAENGSYTVDGAAVTGTHVHEKNAMETTVLVAAPAEGYVFLGWYSREAGKFVSLNAEWTTHLTDGQTLEARFAPANAPIFQVGTDFRFPDLEAAVDFAGTKGPKTVVLVQDGTLPAGEYTIPGGVTLLIPYNNAHTVCTTEPVYHDKDRSTPSSKAYKTLTMASGAHITVQSGGAISVSARAQNTTPDAGVVLGPWGMIRTEADSGITLESGANLYCWGFITGQGSVLARSGAKVYENFQVPAFRGGNASASMNGGAKGKVFPFTQFFIQNVEVPLTFEAGATDNVHIGVTMSVVGLQKGGGTLVGTDSGLFRFTSGTVTKRYDGDTDRLIMEINGDAQIASMAVEIGSAGKISSEKFVVPVTNNMTVHVGSGHTLAVNEDLALLPGAQMIVDEGAELSLAGGKNLYLYDRDEWIEKGYAAQNGRNFCSLIHAPGKKYTRTDADLTDARLDVNGTMTVNGALYTTAGGADIVTSSGNGIIDYQSAAGNEVVTHQVTQSGNTVAVAEVSITAARLKNAAEGVNPYSVTAGAKAGDTFYYHDGMWDRQNAPEGEHYPHVEETGEEKAPTCDETGLTAGSHCSVCGKALAEQEEIPALGHDFETEESVYVQKDNNTHTRKCGHAGCEAENDPVACLAEMTQTKAPTCTAPGEETGTCVCGRELTQEIAIIETAHAWGGWTDSGDGRNHIRICGNNAEHTETAAHTYGDWEVDTEATCGTDGSRHRECAACGYREDGVINATGNHSYADEWSSDDNGHWHECGVCHARTGEAEHTVVTDEAVEATCGKTGLTAGSHCSICGKVLVEQEEIPRKEHDLMNVGGLPATCTQPGVTADKKCKNCTYEIKGGEALPALGHLVEGEWTITREPTCTQAGWRYRVCQRCEGPVGEEIQVLPHTLVKTEAVASTCTEDGSNAYWTCEKCGKVFKDAEGTTETTVEAEIVEAAGHTMTKTEAKEATCTAAGNNAYWSCEKCGKVFKDAEGKTETTAEAETIAVKNHEMTKTEAKDPTCTEAGNNAYWTCGMCGKVFKDAEGTTETTVEAEIVEATSHAMTKTEAGEATCTEDGNNAYWTCGTCGKVFKDAGGEEETSVKEETISALGHSEEHHAEVAATCTTEGTQAYWECTRCSKLFGDEACTQELKTPVTIEKAAHTLTLTEAKEATCTEDGNDAYWSCSACKAIFADGAGTEETTMDDVTIPTNGHTYGEVPTFRWTETPGDYSAVAVFTCGKCAEGTQGHTREENAAVDKKVTEAGHLENGKIEYTARYGEYTDTKDEELKAEGHRLTSYKEKAATCTKPGNIAYWTCSGCDKVFRDEKGQVEITLEETVINAPGHDWGPWKSANGTTHTRTCKRSEMHTETEVHEWGDRVVTKSPTCKQTGTWTYTCKVCGETKTEAIPILPHTWDEGKETKAATCVAGGEKTFTCKVCSATKTEPLDKDPGNHAEIVTDKAVAATCIKTGLTEGSHCEACNTVIKAQETTEMIDHDLTRTAAVAPTCTEDGNLEYWTCEGCGGIFSDGEGRNPITETVVPRQGHDWGEWSQTTAPTCTDVGEKERACQRDGCSASEAEDVVALGHDIKYHDAKDPTCEDFGWAAYEECQRDGCEYSTYKEKQPLDHKWSEWTEVTPAACTEDGEEQRICANDSSHVETREIEAKGHTYGTPEWTWSGSESATATFTCEVCGDSESLSDEEIDESPVNPGCTTEGVIRYTAQVEFNGRIYTTTKDGAKLDPTGHYYTANWTWNDDYTATADLVCTACGDTIGGLDGEVTSKITVEPTCEGEGSERYTASLKYNGNSYPNPEPRYQALDPLGHDRKRVEAVPHTCLVNGTIEHYKCTRCGKLFADDSDDTPLTLEGIVDPAPGIHNEDEGTVTREPTCTQKGTVTYKCTECGTELRTGETDMAAHTLEYVEAREASCTEPGSGEHYACSVCHKLFADEAGETELSAGDVSIPAPGHSYGGVAFAWIQNDKGGWEAAAVHSCQACSHEEKVPATVTIVEGSEVAASCTGTGSRDLAATATLDGEEYTDTRTVELPALGHWGVTDKAVEPTCTGTGLTEGEHCSRCNEVLTAQETVPAKGHDYAAVWTWAADNRSATVKLTCKNEDSHVLTPAVTMTNRTTLEPTYDAQGTAEYTAKATVEGVEFTDSREVTLDRLTRPSGGGSSGGGGGGSSSGGGSSGGSSGGGSAIRPVQPETPATPEQPTPPEEDLGENDTPLVEKPFLFTDVTERDWFYDVVKEVYNRDLMKGTSETRFSPMASTTRGTIVTILHRLEEEPGAKECDFTDVLHNQWYAGAANWAAEAGVVLGYGDGSFRPDTIITREQMTTILFRYARQKGWDMSKKAPLSAFADGSQVSSWSRESMSWAVGVGLIQGNGTNRLDPSGSTTRAEAAAILIRFARLMEAETTAK